MTTPVTEAIREKVRSLLAIQNGMFCGDGGVCARDPCACVDRIAEALVDERKAGMEAAAKIADECNREGPYNAIGAASRIRAAAERIKP